MVVANMMPKYQFRKLRVLSSLVFSICCKLEIVWNYMYMRQQCILSVVWETLNAVMF